MIRVFAGATVANVACGFDILGFSLEAPGDEVTAEISAGKGVTIRAITGDEGRLPLDPEKNSAGLSVLKFLEHLQAREGISLSLHKRMPLGSGLGSSAASAAAALFAANALFGAPLTPRELIPFAMEGERVACGAAHADNVAPALLGGFVLIRSYDPLDVVELEVPGELHAAVCHPHLEVKTADARRILRPEIKLKSAVRQWGNVAGLIAGLYREDYQLISRSLEDVIIEPARSGLIPGFTAVKDAALANGALGCSISGSGPSIFSLCRGKEVAQLVAESMAAAFGTIGVGSETFVSAINKGTGARVLDLL